MSQLVSTAKYYIPVYCYDYDVDTDQRLLWQTGQAFHTDDEAIASVMSYPSIRHLRIVEVELPEFELPSTLKSLKYVTAKETEYGQASTAEQHEGERNPPQPHTTDREIFSGT